MSQPNDYTVGWICAVSTEYVAAQAFLDEKHDGPEYVSPNDANDYALGKIGKHNVVIAVLPDGEYGITSATAVAKDMMHSFPNIRIGLMVGIAGGAPNRRHDIRLGDVVVSAPRDGKSGVLQYDLGKTIQNQTLKRIGILTPPPPVLRAAVNGLKAHYEIQGHTFEEYLHKIFKERPRLRKKYSRPEPSSDMLYQAGIIHPIDDDSSCTETCGNDPSKLVARSGRSEGEDNPSIHYGIIASGNQLMKDASIRDKLSLEEGILCFEMEAAGLMNSFPCLVVRGICDYSDSHKNKEWQGYAAMMAAAYARDLLYRITPSRIEAEEKLSKVMSGLQAAIQVSQDISKEHRDISKEHLQIQRNIMTEQLSQEAQKCHQEFRLRTGDTTYEWYKDRVEQRVDGTCLWFLNHQNFRAWLEEQSGPLLVTADPGCGKSVLARYLVDGGLIKHGMPQATIICYYFFKDQDQNTIRQALCAILHQLFSLRMCLINHAIPEYRKDGKNLVNSTTSLWKILRNSVADPEAGPITIVLDALGECADSASLINSIGAQFYSDLSESKNIKFLLTCRPYSQIIYEFDELVNTFPKIHIPAEEEFDQISKEINNVITHRMKKFSQKKRLSTQVQSHLMERLQNTTHRTYLWVHLVFEHLKYENIKKTIDGIDSAIETLPKSVNEAYERILSRSGEYNIVRKALSIILAAKRPLTISEMNIAINININSTPKTTNDPDLESDEDFKERLRQCCGLFISIHQHKIYFLHQTAREFLIADHILSKGILSKPRWHNSIAIRDAHRVLAECCVYTLHPNDHTVQVDTDNKVAMGDIFFDYSALYWTSHFRESDFPDCAAINDAALRICDTTSESCSIWLSHRGYGPDPLTDLFLASYYGHTILVQRLLGDNAGLETKDSRGMTPLLWAAQRGHQATVRLLVERGADLDARNISGETALILAVREENYDVIELLVESGANLDARSYTQGDTPLVMAAKRGDQAIAQLLIDKGADLKAGSSEQRERVLYSAACREYQATVQPLVKKQEDAYLDIRQFIYREAQMPLHWASRHGRRAVVRLLLEHGVNIDAADDQGRTPLIYAAWNGRHDVVLILLEKGADLRRKDESGMTALSCAAGGGHQDVVLALLEKGADLKARDDLGQTALFCAVKDGHLDTVILMLERGADLKARDICGRTPLSWASTNGKSDMTQLLLKNGADPEVRHVGEILLLWAAESGDQLAVQLLLEAGIALEARDNWGQGLLFPTSRNRHQIIVELPRGSVDPQTRSAIVQMFSMWVIDNGYQAIVQRLHEKRVDPIELLLENGLEEKEKKLSQTPLLWASMNGHLAVARLLVEQGADLEAKDNTHYRTPLSWATINGHVAIVRLLLEKGVDLDTKDQFQGRTPLILALENRDQVIAQLLIEKGADLEAKSYFEFWTPLFYAAKHGDKTTVQLLLEKGAVLKASYGVKETPLTLATMKGHHAIVQILLEKGALLKEGYDIGSRPLEIALQVGNPVTIQLLAEFQGIPLPLL